MTVYKPKRSPYFAYDFVFKGQRYAGSTGLDSKRKAEQFEGALRRQVAFNHAMGGAPERKEEISLNDAIGTYVANRLTGKPDAHNAKGRAKRLLAHFGAGTLLSEITAADIAAFGAMRRAKVKDSTTNRDLEFMRRVRNYAEVELEREVGKPIPWGKLRYAEPEERVRELSDAEERRILGHLRADLVDFVRFALIRGIRLSGNIGLRWRDVDLDAGTLTYVVKGSRTKPGGPRTKRLTAAELAIIRRQPKAGPFVFTYVAQTTRGSFSRKNGRRVPGRVAGERYPLQARLVQAAITEACKAAGVDDFHFHDTRHTAATRLARSAKNLKIVQAMLDHRDIKTTAKYAHATEDDLLQAMIAAESRIIPGQRTDDSDKSEVG